MSEAPEKHPRRPPRSLSQDVGEKEARKVRARRRKDRNIWFGLGAFGIVGWSIAIPTLIGLAIGIWIDNTWPSRFSWTLTFFLGGLLVGCLTAWYWINFEGRVSEEEEQEERKRND